jgi:hypothetical protein
VGGADSIRSADPELDRDIALPQKADLSGRNASRLIFRRDA